MSKLRVPAARIPPAMPTCLYCGGYTKTIASTPHATGQHRRHQCLTPTCAKRFYTLADYKTWEVVGSRLPFKDRALTPLETIERQAWIDEARQNATVPVTPKGNRVKFHSESVARLNKALATPPASRDKVEAFLAVVWASIEEELEQMDANQEDGGSVEASDLGSAEGQEDGEADQEPAADASGAEADEDRLPLGREHDSSGEGTEREHAPDDALEAEG